MLGVFLGCLGVVCPMLILGIFSRVGVGKEAVDSVVEPIMATKSGGSYRSLSLPWLFEGLF